MNTSRFKKAKILKIILNLSFLLFSAKEVFAMHISEGILPMKWALTWGLAAIPFLVVGIIVIKRRSKSTLSFKPLLGMMGAVVFIISCMPIPVPTAGTCSHPCGTGISAILIGPIMSIFVASIALLLQALFLAHGGLTTWGADIVSMGIAGSFAAFIAFRILRSFKAPLFISGFIAGILADWATYMTTSFELASALHGAKPMFPMFTAILVAFIPTQLPLGILEGFLTGGIVVFVARRRPDILLALGAIKESQKSIMKGAAKALLIIFVVVSVVAVCPLSFAQENSRWPGIDKTIVEKVAEKHGRPARTPFINTGQGDLLLFVFLLAGTAGGFVLGYNFQKLFGAKSDAGPAGN